MEWNLVIDCSVWWDSSCSDSDDYGSDDYGITKKTQGYHAEMQSLDAENTVLFRNVLDVIEGEILCHWHPSMILGFLYLEWRVVFHSDVSRRDLGRSVLELYGDATNKEELETRGVSCFWCGVYVQKVVIWRNWKLMIWRRICDTMACAWLAIRPLLLSAFRSIWCEL